MDKIQVYCFKDYSKENEYKVGKTTQGWEVRLNQLNHNTGSIENNTLEVVLAKVVDDCTKAEKYLHDKLSDYRISSRKEFFKVDIRTIKHWFDKYPGRYVENRMPYYQPSAPPPTEHIIIPMEVPIATVLTAPFIVQDWSPQRQEQQCVTKDTVNKMMCALMVVGTIAIIVTVIIFLAQKEGSG